MLGHMTVSQHVRVLCRSVFPSGSVASAVLVLETYAKPDAEWVHRAAVGLSEGRLHRLVHWLSAAEQDIEMFRWYAGEAADVSDETRRFAVDFVNGLADRSVLGPPGAP